MATAQQARHRLYKPFLSRRGIADEDSDSGLVNGSMNFKTFHS
jgi:hypothetical protein